MMPRPIFQFSTPPPFVTHFCFTVCSTVTLGQAPMENFTKFQIFVFFSIFIWDQLLTICYMKPSIKQLLFSATFLVPHCAQKSLPYHIYLYPIKRYRDQYHQL